MKIKIFSILLGLILLAVFNSCENTNTYSAQLRAEQKKIDNYLSREGYSILPTFPADTVFDAKKMYHFKDGIYFQLIDKGTGDTAQYGDQIAVRYMQSTLDASPIVEEFWSTMDKAYPTIVTYGISSTSCDGWEQALKIMKRTDSYARIIVPSKVGFDNSEVVPYLYELKIKIVPK